MRCLRMQDARVGMRAAPVVPVDFFLAIEPINAFLQNHPTCHQTRVLPWACSAVAQAGGPEMLAPYAAEHRCTRSIIRRNWTGVTGPHWRGRRALCDRRFDDGPLDPRRSLLYGLPRSSLLHPVMEYPTQVSTGSSQPPSAASAVISWPLSL